MKSRVLAVLTLGLGVLTAAASSPRTAQQLLQDYEKVKLPVVDAAKLGDAAYLRSYANELDRALERQGALAWELIENHPSHPAVAEKLLARWRAMASSDAKLAAALNEMEQFLKTGPADASRPDVLYQRAVTMENSTRPDEQKDAAIEDFIRAAPHDERGADLLLTAAAGMDDAAARVKAYRRVVAQYAGTLRAKVAAGILRQADEIGKPFDLRFADATSGRQISLAELKGKVVVIDFWATSCGQCVADMPKLQELYAKFKQQGVEFIGVNLDGPGDNGLEKVQRFVAANGISWPQYYQGNGWFSEFSVSWGINTLPAMFVVDAVGNLHSTAAREQLEALIPELLKRRTVATRP